MSLFNSSVITGGRTARRSSLKYKIEKQKKSKYAKAIGMDDEINKYDDPRISKNRPYVYWGGYFTMTDDNISRFGSPTGSLKYHAFSKLPKIATTEAGSMEGGDMTPELIIIEGQPSTGKTTLAYHYLKNYSLQTRPKMPVFFMSKGYETNFDLGYMGSAAKYATHKDEPKIKVKHLKKVWTDFRDRRCRFDPTSHAHVIKLAPPYKPQSVIEKCDGNILKFHPTDVTPPLLQAFTMMVSSSATSSQDTGEPKYMQPARELVAYIKEGHSLSECYKWIDRRKEGVKGDPDDPGYTYWTDKQAMEKLRGGARDLYMKGLDINAPTMKERLLERDTLGNAPLYVIDLEQNNPKADAKFVNAIVQAISDVCESMDGQFYPKTKFIPPAIFIDDATNFISEFCEIMDFIRDKRFVRGPIILIVQDIKSLPESLIKFKGKSKLDYSGFFTHYHRCRLNFTCFYMCKYQIAKPNPKDYEDKTPDQIQEMRDEYNENPPYMHIDCNMKPSEMLVSK